MPTARLLRAHKSLRACVGWVETDYWRKREARSEGENAPQVPSTQNRVRYPTLVEVLLPFPNRNCVVHAGDPALAVIEV